MQVRLVFDEVEIRSLSHHQFAVGANLYNPPHAQYHYLICISHCTQSVSYYKHAPVFTKPL